MNTKNEEFENAENINPEYSQFTVKKYDLSAYPADYTITTILEKYNKVIIVPEFQRNYVWSDLVKQSRLIESLLLGLPIPQIFLFAQKDSSKLLLIDGFQRLKTIHRYVNNAFALTGITKEYEGQKYEDLSSSDREFLDSQTIRSIIIRQNSPEDNSASMYYIFERLNTGGEILTPMEIRKAIFYGEFYKNMEKFNRSSQAWRKIWGKEEDLRLEDIEWILKIIAFYQTNMENYTGSMTDYLTLFMRDFKENPATEIFELLDQACKKIITEFGDDFSFHFPEADFLLSYKFNAEMEYFEVVELLIIGLMNNPKLENLKEKYNEILLNFSKKNK